MEIAMSEHRDKFRSAPPTDEYKQNHERIFGPPKGTKGMDKEKLARMRAEHHMREAATGKKDAQYYLDNEQRVPMSPDYNYAPLPNNQYRENWGEIFGKKADDGEE
jgi:hypothetical protein